MGKTSPRLLTVWARVALALALVLTLLPAGTESARAATAAPVGLSPSSDAVTSSSPVLTWQRVADATRYDVQASTSDTFATTIFSRSTTNRQFVPVEILPEGPVFWRVRAVAGSDASAWTTTRILVSATLAPVPKGPANGGAPLDQPSDPPLLSWTAVPGATSYQVEVDTEQDFVGASSWTTKTTSFVVPDPKAQGTYHWRVRAQLANGLYTAFSQPWQYAIDRLDPVIKIGPAENSAVEDVVLEWEPVAGAKTYELQVSTDQDFNTIVESRVNLKGTRYSPPTTYLNDQYFWRVRARNNQGETFDWTEVTRHNFQRHWPDQPQQVYPPSRLSPPAGDDFYFEWTAVDHATRYQLDVGTDPNFSTAGVTYKTCYTAGTTYTPGYRDNPADKCMPSQGVVHYWRVRALDDPKGVQGIYSAIGSFVYSSGAVQRISPADGATVASPTLKWQASREAEKYRVIVTNASGGTVAQVDTYSLSWTPMGTTPMDPAKGPYRWTVQAIDIDGRLSPKYPDWTFQVGGAPASSGQPPLTPLTGTAGNAPTTRFPNLTWEPHPSAAYYRVDIGIHGSGFWFEDAYSPILKATYAYASATDTGGVMLTPAQYDWQVEAFTKDNISLGRGALGSFTIADLEAATGQQAAVTGSRLDAGTGCDVSLGGGTSAYLCEDLPTTPVLDWEPVPGAAFYKVYLARDRELTNLVYSSIPATSNSRWTPPQLNGPMALPDSQAGQAYYWFIRPCKTETVCAPDPVSTALAADHAFDKLSPSVEASSPASGAEVSANQVRFVWKDYLATNRAQTFGATGESGNQAAKQYRIQVSQSASFATLIDDQLVDQATYTAFDRTYPEGTLHWRVQAVDAAGNGLTWSPARSFTKQSPAPQLSAPKGAVGSLATACPTGSTSAGCTNGVSPFVWAPTLFAGSYQLEVYKNDDSNWSLANRVISTTVKQAAYAHSAPLPASSSAYVWRVARLDADGRAGQWSATGRFYSRGAAPTQNAPANGAMVSGYAPYFSWTTVPEAVSYRFERRPQGSSTLSENVTTKAQGWAPTAVIGTGTWEWRVVAIDVTGAELGSSAWRTVRVDNGRGTFTPMAPKRILDTRVGLGAAQRQVGPGQTITVTVADLPMGATSVALNVTVTGPTLESHQNVWPYGATRPTTSNLNYVKGQTVPNMVMATVGSGGRVSFYNNSGYVHVIADINGYFAPDLGSGYTPKTPTRVLDTRSGVGGTASKIGSRQVITLKVPGLPSGTTAVAMNVTVTEPTAASHLRVFPAGSAPPSTSNLNYVARQTVPNLVTVGVGPDNTVSFYNESGSTHVIADLAGYYARDSSGEYAGITPKRVMDTRAGLGAPKAKISSGQVVTLTIPGLPAGTTAVALNVTVTQTTWPGHLIVYPADASRPSTSSLNFVANQTVPNMVIVKVGSGGKVSFYNSSGSVHVIADLAGSYVG